MALVIFDVPAANDVFERRLEALHDLLAPRFSYFEGLLGRAIEANVSGYAINSLDTALSANTMPGLP